jgi:pSer/pThr/pTyr-binding forkhead associated (FHA) protein/S1-C subfamily serine protease
MSAQRLSITVDQRTWTFEPADSPVRIGRDTASDVAIEREGISRHHAQIECAGDTWTFRDMNSTQGSYIDGERVTTSAIGGAVQFTLSRGQHAVRVGVDIDPIIDDLDRTVAASPDATAVVGQAARPGGVLAPGAAAGATQVTGETIVVECAGSSYTFSPGRKYVIGRDAGVDVPSPNPNVSRRHAVLEYRDGWHLDDLDSSGGTFLDGRRTKTTGVAGTMAFLLGDLDAGERVVVKASGTREITTAQRFSRLGSGGKVGMLAGGLALAAIVIGLVAWLATRGSGKPDFDELTRGVVSISVTDNAIGGAGGSGTIVDKELGLILTNAHVAGWGAGEGLALNYGYNEMWFSDIDDIVIAVSPGADRSAEPKFRAKLVAVDGYLDLAVVQLTETLTGKIVEPVDLEELTEIELGSVRELATGDDIFVLGFPGVANNSAVTLTDGSLSGFVTDQRVGDNRAWVQMDVQIRGGNSGGMMADEEGRLIAVPSQSTGLQQLRPGEASISQSRAVDFALPLIEAARNGTPYVSPYITALTGEEDVPGVFYGNLIEREEGITYECSDAFIDNPSVGSSFLAMQVDYVNFTPDRHQDVWVAVERQAITPEVQQAYADAGVPLPDKPEEPAYEGFVMTQWEAKVPRADGCLTATIPLQTPLLELVDYKITVHVGGNLKILFEKTFTPSVTS